jgi:hypothetical protein
MKPLKSLAGAAMLVALASVAPAQDRTQAPQDAMVYLLGLEDGATVSSPVTIVFGLKGMGVAPAGVERDGTGHHHVLINRAPWGEGDGDAEALKLGLPADDNHRHFGGGQTEVTLDLPPGTHSLQLVLGDHNHVPHDPPVVSEVITVMVE